MSLNQIWLNTGEIMRAVAGTMKQIRDLDAKFDRRMNALAIDVHGINLQLSELARIAGSLPNVSDYLSLKKQILDAIDADHKEIRDLMGEQSRAIILDLDTIVNLLTADSAQPAVAFRAFLVDDNGQIIREILEGETMDMKVTDNGVHVRLKSVDKFGNAAPLDGAVAWSKADESVVLTPSADGLEVDIVPGHVPGQTIVTGTGDADLGEGVKSLVFTLPINLLPGDAVEFQADVTPIPDVVVPPVEPPPAEPPAPTV